MFSNIFTVLYCLKLHLFSLEQMLVHRQCCITLKIAKGIKIKANMKQNYHCPNDKYERVNIISSK